MNPGSNAAASMDLSLNLPPHPAKREVVDGPDSNSKKPKTQAPPDLTLSLHLPLSSSPLPTSSFAPRSSRYLTFKSDVSAAPGSSSDLWAIKPNKPDLKDFVFYPLAGAGSLTPEINNEGADSDSEEKEEVVVGIPGKFLEDIVSRSVPRMAEVINLLSDEFINAVKNCLTDLIRHDKKINELTGLQNMLQGRSDLTVEVLTRAHRAQLEILVATKTGLRDFLWDDYLSSGNLVEIFMHLRCKHSDCNIRLPLDVCLCQACLKDKGFCKVCTCLICLEFDNCKIDMDTITWMECGQCFHWCHTACGVKGGLIRATNDLNEAPDMVFFCPTPGCGNEYDMFRFVKYMFKEGSQRWGRYEMMKELSCVIQMFKESRDLQGMELLKMAREMRGMLEGRLITPPDVLNEMLRFFKYEASKSSVTGSSSKKVISPQTSQPGDILLPWLTIITPLRTAFNLNETSSILVSDTDELKTDTEPPACEPHFSMAEEDGPQSLETIIELKDAEAEMYLSLADDARKEAVQYQHIINTKSMSLKAEYGRLLLKLSLLETEKLMMNVLVEQLKLIASSHFDYNNMIMRMQNEIVGFLEDYRRGFMINSKILEEDCGSLLVNLSLLETEERMTNALEEELKFLENFHFDYNNMIMRMQDEVASLLEEIETM